MPITAKEKRKKIKELNCTHLKARTVVLFTTDMIRINSSVQCVD